MNKIFKIIVVFILFCISINLDAQHKIYLEILPGAAYVLPSYLTIEQEGYPDIKHLARYEIRSFDSPIYYSVRTGITLNESTALEIELNHLKLYLDNNPPEIQRFSISHGYNQLWFNVRKEFAFFDLRAGIGPVVAHPENTVREQKLSGTGGLFNNGYFLNGITSQLALQKRIFFGDHFYLNAETKLNVSYTRTHVVDGHAKLWVYAIHGLLGVGVTF
jgi:hypothetical protein